MIGIRQGSLLFSFSFVILAVLASGCVGQQGLNNTNATNITNYTNYTSNYTNYTTLNGVEYVNCTATQPSLITTIENPDYSPEYETEPYLRQISEPSGAEISLVGTVKTRVLAEGTRSEWSYNYLETDDGKTYILNGRHWSSYPNFNYGNFYVNGLNPKVNVTGQKVTIYPMGKDQTSYGQYPPQDGILITSIEGYQSACCYQKLASGGYSPQICIWSSELELQDNQTHTAQTPNPYFSGYLFSVNDNLYFVAAHRFLSPTGGNLSTVEGGAVLTADRIKAMTSLENITPKLANPTISKDQAKTIAKGKLSEVVSLYKSKLDAFDQEMCVSECMKGTPSGNERVTPECNSSECPVAIPCPNDESYCRQYCEQKGIALNKGYALYSNVTVSEPSLLYDQYRGRDQYANATTYQIFCTNSENIGVMLSVDASSGEVTPPQISAPDSFCSTLAGKTGIYTYVNPYSGLLDWNNMSSRVSGPQARGIMQNYMKQHSISGTVSDVAYIGYVIKWGSKNGPY